jgi:hypothetical protein
MPPITMETYCVYSAEKSSHRIDAHGVQSFFFAHDFMRAPMFEK